MPSIPGHFPGVLLKLTKELGESRVLSSGASLASYARDNTGSCYWPWAVVLADTRQHVETTLRLCHEANIPVVPRGAGTGNVGGSLPVQGGVVLSLQRMNRIHEVSGADRLAVVEPGVVNADLQTFLKPHRLFWPPNPSSARSCSIGGNIAMCAAGPNAVCYGVTRDWVLGLEAVLPDGRVFRTGGRTTKGVVGYDMTRLLIGSEGTLAIVTQATLKLAPLPEAKRLVRVIFRSVLEACQGVCALMAEGESPSAIEFLDASALDLLRQTGSLSLPTEGRAMLLLEVSGSAESVDRLTQLVVSRLDRFDVLEKVASQGGEASSSVWAAREALSPALKNLAPKRINEDVVVPVSCLPQLMQGLGQISLESGILIVNFGHAGNGNIHVNLLVDPAESSQMTAVNPTLEKVFRLVLDLRGSLSGEHGIGIQKQTFVPWELDPTQLFLQRSIKTLFDPKGILNPGKIFP